MKEQEGRKSASKEIKIYPKGYDMFCENCNEKTYCLYLTRIGNFCDKCEDKRRKFMERIDTKCEFCNIPLTIRFVSGGKVYCYCHRCGLLVVLPLSAEAKELMKGK